MKLIIIVIEDDDTPALIRKLTEQGYRSTKLASTGGFLLQGNTTLLVGVEDEHVDPVLDIIRQTCVRRKKLLPHVASEIPTAINLPVEVEVGGAIVFVVDVQQFHEM
ncbi:MAG: hypothetical protein GX208_09785 [Firmicutes bacterium]|nr:hypothetical protein [Bacillota bacterium]